MLFRELGLRSEIIESLDTMGYQEPTEVQSLVIPQAVAGKNIIAQSQTGSGKTAAFVIPILNAIDTGLRKPQALILEPTRELAMQSKEEVWNLSK
jgi:ATP-dependent RNA helicase DeaD